MATCWGCRYIVLGGLRFVQDFACRHPQRKQDSVIEFPLDSDELEEGCRLYDGKDEDTEPPQRRIRERK